MNRYLIIASVILACLVYPVVVFPNDQSHKDGILKFIVRILGDLSILLLLSLLISSILSLLLMKSKPYISRFKTFLPPITLSVLIVTTLILIFSKKMKFDEIDISVSLNCNSLKQGVYICQNLEIKRNENIQIETDKNSNTIKEYQINWKSDCEYELIGINSNTQNFKVKIIEVNQKGHKAYVSKLNSNSAQLIEMKNK